jgi:tetratricopeptide (TPR) repeat protein
MTRGPQPSSWATDEESLLAAARGAVAARRDLPPIPGLELRYEIGRGGQGVVYAATDARTGAAAAVKVLALDGLGAFGAEGQERARQRFRREIDAVTALDHPGIVRVRDSGELDDGRPYLVMELVEGIPLDEHVLGADRGALLRGGATPRDVDAGELVRLFIEITAALEHAHGRGVIHRDLKPPNIRVDERGQPRILDFGLARALAAPDAALPIESLTRTGGVLGSLAWASPEQLTGRPEDVDARSDVYAVGAMLFHLLTGRPPHDLSGSLRDVVKRVEQDAPQRPSRFAPCPPDLDAVATRALARRPEDRYQTMADLRRDLERVRDGEPVEARRANAWRAVQRSVRRWRRVAVAAGAIGVVALALALALATLFIRARDAERLAQQRLDEAVAAMRRAEATIAILEDTLTAADPAGPAVPDRAARDMLDRAAERLELDAGADPFVRGAVASTIGRAYYNLGLFDRADPVLTAAVADLRTARAAVDAGAAGDVGLDVRLVETIESLGLVRHAQGRYEEAADLFAQAGAAAGASPAAIRVDVRRAVMMADRGDLRGARAVLEPALARARAIHPSVAALPGYRLGMVLHHLGDHEAAAPLLEEALEAFQTWEGEDSLRAAECLVAIGALQSNGPDPASALPTLARARAIYDARLGPRSDRRADCLLIEGSVLGRTDDPDGAEARHAEAVAILAERLGPDHPRVGDALDEHAVSLRRVGRLDEALATWDRALAILRRAYGDGSRGVGFALRNQGYGLIEAGRRADALPALVEARAILAPVLGEADPTVAELDVWIARLEAVVAP